MRNHIQFNHKHHFHTGLFLTALLLLTTACMARSNFPVGRTSEETWRIAGTFNNWNLKDDSMKMTPLNDGRYFIQTTFPAGQILFKFVKNGDWANGHFGSVQNKSQRISPDNLNQTYHLTTPGDNIVLDFTTPRPVAIILDPAKRTWQFGTPIVKKPVIVAEIRDLPRVGLPVTIDLSQTLLPNNSSLSDIEIKPENTGTLRILKNPDNPGNNPHKSKWQRIIIPNKTGNLGVIIRAKVNGKWTTPTTIRFQVFDRVFAVLPFRARQGPIDLVPIDGTEVWAALVNAPGTGVITAKIEDLGKGAYVTAVIEPKRTGESFILRYSRRTNSARFIPGDFSLRQNGMKYDLIDHDKIPANGFLHDPRKPDQFTPISAGLGLVDITVRTNENTESLTIFVMKNTNAGDDNDFTTTDVMMTIPMTRMNNSKTRGSGELNWKARIKLPKVVRGRANAPWIRYWIQRSNKNNNTLSNTAADRFGPYEAQIKPDFETPDWAKEAVWYQIFPERFRNGNKLNDPHGQGVFPTPWNSAWHEIQPGEFQAWQARVRANGGNPDKWDRNNTGEPGGRFYNVVWDRRYGGDLQGIIQSLDYLQKLGINAIYINPVFEAQSLHKYDTTDYRHIDDNFGNTTTRPPAVWQPDPTESYDDPDTWKWTEADLTFLKLIKEVHKRNMRIIIDGVFNHVGRFHPAFQDVVKNGRKSPYADWFTCKFDENGKLISWTAWDGPNGWLPKLKQNADRSLVYPVEKHIFDITRRWMDPNGDGNPADGIDGWRLDVPLEIGDSFWRDWCDEVRSINPDAYITAEIWSNWEAVDRLKGDEFDAQMNYPFARGVIDFLAMKPTMTGNALNELLDKVFADDNPQTQLVQQNLLASHDTDRLVSDLFNNHPPREYDKGNRPQQGEKYDEAKPDKRAYALDRLALVIQATYEGAPMIYYGQEIGMYGADDPSCRKPFPWPDTLPMKDPDESPDLSLKNFYQKWLNARENDETLQLGMVIPVKTKQPDIFAFQRRLNDEIRLVIINKGNQPFPLADFPAASTHLTIPTDIAVPPLSALMLTIE